MCYVAFIPAAMAMVAAAGSAYSSYRSGQQSAHAVKVAQDQAAVTQNIGFNERMAAQRQQLADQTAINTAAADRFATNQAAEQAALSGDLTARQNAINDINTQTRAISTQADNTVSQGLQAVTPGALADAKAAQVEQQTAMNAPVVANIQASNPLGAASTGLTRDAMDKGNAAAAKYVHGYGDTQANLSGYSVPVALARDTATGINTNLMPVAALNNLVQSSAPAILQPSTTAYQQDKNYAGDVNQANAMTVAGATGLANSTAANKITIADLLQGDTLTNIQNMLSAKQRNAASDAGVAQGIGSIANAMTSFAGSQGAFSTKPAIT